MNGYWGVTITEFLSYSYMNLIFLLIALTNLIYIKPFTL